MSNDDERRSEIIFPYLTQIGIKHRGGPNEKILYIFLAVVLILALGGVLYHSFLVNSPKENERITQEDTEKLREYLGL